MDSQTGPTLRSSIADDAKWNLSGLYASDDFWQEDCEQFESRLNQYEKFKGTLSQSAAQIRSCLEFDMDLSRKLEALYNYAHLKNDEDKTNSTCQGNFDKITRLATQAAEASSFIRSELMSIPEENMNRYLEDPALEFFRLFLDRMLRFRSHTLSEKEEALLASSMDMSRATQEAFGMLNNADLAFGSIKDEAGQTITITHGNFQSLMQNYNREIRKSAFETYYSKYQEHQFTFSALLSGSITKDIFYSRNRKYPSVREKALFSDNILPEVYDNLIATVHNHFDPLHKYFSLRKKVLNLEMMHLYDCSVPLTKNIHWHVRYPDAVEKIIEALKPLGTEYGVTLKKGLLEDRWVDRYENKGKRSGAYSSGCYDSSPFILMNYREDDINSVYTLAHEAGHSMHSYYSRKSQSYLYSDYTIFVAEVASTFNEALLTQYFLNQDPDPQMRIYLVCREIDNLRGTLFRQTMFAEFEHRIYAMAEKGEPLTLESFKNLYKTLLERYFGECVVLDDPLLLECFRIPHFYFSFYVYKYATGISAAYSLAERVLKGGPSELEDYLKFLNAGGTKYPLDLLKDAGVDMTTPQPIEKTLEKFSYLVDQLESLVN